MSAGQMARLLATVYGALLAATLLVMIVVLATCPRAARAALGLPFTGVPADVSQALAIFATNAKITLAAFAAAVAVNAPWLTARGRQDTPGPAWQATRSLCDLVLGAATLTNVVVVGVALGAYQERMVVAIVPHGPVELLGFACPLALYLHARCGPVAARTWMGLVAVALVALAAAALLEVFVIPWGPR